MAIESNDPFGEEPDAPSVGKKSLPEEWGPPVLFHNLEELVSKDGYEEAAIKILKFLNKYERDSLGNSGGDDVGKIRVELLAQLLRKEFGK